MIKVYRSTSLINYIRRGIEVPGSVTKPAEAGSIQPSLDGQSLTTADSHLRGACHLKAIDTFRIARKIAPHAGIVQSTLRLFDELAKCNQDGILKDIRPAVQGKE